MIKQLSHRTIIGGLLGLALACTTAELLSSGLYEVYSKSMVIRNITGESPNFTAEWLKIISWAFIFGASWWMFWCFDNFFSPDAKVAKSTENTPTEESDPSGDEKTEEAFKPESDDDSETEKIGDKTEHTEENDGDENEKSDHDSQFDETDELFFKVQQIPEESPRDFNSIKTVYRKKIAQYHPDKVSAMGPEIREVAEQKAKEINEAYEHFRKKQSQ